MKTLLLVAIAYCLPPKDKKKQLIDSILSLTNSFNLVDLWRKFHPNESLFTWHHQSSAIHCRLDYWLVSKHLLPTTRPSRLNIQFDDFIKRGPGVFKFNNSLLDDQCFVEGLSEKIPEYKQKYNYLEDKKLYWDMLKNGNKKLYILLLQTKCKDEKG